MLYLYDNALIDDIKSAINSDNANPNVFMMDPETYPGILAQIQDDTITYPLIMVKRDDDMPIITELSNFTRSHAGVPVAFDTETNNLYFERSVPMDIRYTISVVATSTADADELARELFYKYLSQYYLTIRLPYESDRKIRFGVVTELGYGIKRESGSFEYTKTGALYQSTIHLLTQGCVYLSYTPRHLQRQILSNEIKIVPPNNSDE